MKIDEWNYTMHPVYVYIELIKGNLKLEAVLSKFRFNFLCFTLTNIGYLLALKIKRDLSETLNRKMLARILGLSKNLIE